MLEAKQVVVVKTAFRPRSSYYALRERAPLVEGLVLAVDLDCEAFEGDTYGIGTLGVALLPRLLP